jgi:hypothetical protein
MKYILVEDRKIVHLVTDWRYRFIQRELDDLEIDFIAPPVEVGYIKINNNFEIFPITSSEMPDYDPIFEQLAGPFYEYRVNEVAESYLLNNRSIESIKTSLKEKVAAMRYNKEVAGVKITIQGKEITIETDRDTRNIFVQKYMLMDDNSTSEWKFPEGWLTLTKLELGTIIQVGANYIQSQFDWERNVSDQVDVATNINELRNIEID